MTQVIPDRDTCAAIANRRCVIKKCPTVLVIFTLISSAVFFIIFWCTNVFHHAIVSNLIVSKESSMFDWWLRPPIRTVYKIRIFNYTNVDDYQRGNANKLIVNEVGPYIYRETLTRENNKFYENGTISFQDKRTFQWENGSPDDEIVIVPNIPLFTAVALARDLGFIAQLSLTTVLSALQPEPFIKVPAGGFLWGYDDKLFDVAKPVVSLVQDIPINKFGILAMKNGLSKDVVTMHTGKNNLDKLGMIERVNGKNTRDVWGADKCDRVYGSLGFFYPPEMYMNEKNTLDVYGVDMCRTLRLNRVGTGSAFGIPTISYKPPLDEFHSTPSKDYCFCSKNSPDRMSTRTCPPKGIFNVSSCIDNLPLVASYPHFLGGEASLFSNIDGLKPQVKLHETHLQLHPNLGLVINGNSRVQLNVETRKAIAVPFLGNLPDGQILPLMWVDVGLDTVPDGILSILKHAYFTANYVDAFFRWGSIVIIISCLFALKYLFRKNGKSHAVLKRNASGEDKLLEDSA